jgi:hypothetical protein
VDLGKPFRKGMCFRKADGAGGSANNPHQATGIIRVHDAKPGNLGSTIDAENAHSSAV